MAVHPEITDADRYLQYEKGFFPILKKHGGSFVTFDDKTETLEGSAPIGGRMVTMVYELPPRG